MDEPSPLIPSAPAAPAWSPALLRATSARANREKAWSTNCTRTASATSPASRHLRHAGGYLRQVLQRLHGAADEDGPGQPHQQQAARVLRSAKWPWDNSQTVRLSRTMRLLCPGCGSNPCQPEGPRLLPEGLYPCCGRPARALGWSPSWSPRPISGAAAEIFLLLFRAPLDTYFGRCGQFWHRALS